ncbi:HNH endonuclease [Aliivibrio wodanis]|uniref:HNH endonuclease n=1 Tax=Aliivibrio wodanis TaxID=80852 RepID=UPI00406C41A0
MASYVFTWNPERWNWLDLQNAISLVANGEEYIFKWSSGNTKKIVPGDTFFLLRQGENPRGIIGFGTVVSKSYDFPHWDIDRAKNGDVAPRNDLSFKVLSELPIIPLSDLEYRFPEYNWSPRVGGLSLYDDISHIISCELESLITNKILETKYTEGGTRKITITKYDRSPQAREDCIQEWGYACKVCGFDFEAAYGEYGNGYIEVHHLKPISSYSEVHEICPKEDLRPVCANCHRMLHKTRNTLSIEELKKHLLARS